MPRAHSRGVCSPAPLRGLAGALCIGCCVLGQSQGSCAGLGTAHLITMFPRQGSRVRLPVANSRYFSLTTLGIHALPFSFRQFRTFMRHMSVRMS